MEKIKFFATTPPGKLFAMAAIPGALGMLASVIYQAIDGALIGHILGSEAFAAVNLVMPLIIVNFSLADLIGVGSSVPIAIKLGEQDDRTASNIFTCSCLMIFSAAILAGAIFFIFGSTFLRWMGADENLINLGMKYLRIFAVCSPFMTIFFAADNYLRLCGKIRYSLYVNVAMSAASGILEWLLLAVFHWDVRGSAVAACFTMSVCAAVSIAPFLTGKQPLRFVHPVFNKKLFSDIIQNGLPAFLSNIAGRITSIIMNVMLLRLGGPDAVSAYGVLMYAEGIIRPLLYGLCDSLQPAVGYNWGAHYDLRVKAIEKHCFGWSAAFSITFAAVVMIHPSLLAQFFVSSENSNLLRLTLRALPFFAAGYLIRWFSFAVQSLMSALEQAKYATILSLSNALFFPLIFIIIFNHFGLDGLWLNFPATCILDTILAAFFLQHYLHWYRREKNI